MFRFGHGLGYTRFEHSDLHVAAASTRDPVTVEVTTTNTGDRVGVDVVQLYVRDDVASLARPDRQLVGFARVELGPGDACRIAFEVHPSKLAFYDESMRFVCEPGAFTWSIGASADRIDAQQSATLDGEPIEYRQAGIVATKVTVS